MTDDDEAPYVTEPGQTVYDADGRRLGTIRGWDEDGFYVTTREGIEALSVEHAHPTPAGGEAYLMWRCSVCGAMGDIEDIPDACPDCGAEREQLYYWVED